MPIVRRSVLRFPFHIEGTEAMASLHEPMASDGGSSMKCPSCDGTRNSTGETYGPRKVWVSDGVPFHPPETMLSVPPAIGPYVSPSIRCGCLNPPCVFGIVFRYWLIGDEMMIIGNRKCPRCQGRGFTVMRLGQSALMPLRRETIAWAEMAKGDVR